MIDLTRSLGHRGLVARTWYFDSIHRSLFASSPFYLSDLPSFVDIAETRPVFTCHEKNSKDIVNFYIGNN